MLTNEHFFCRKWRSIVKSFVTNKIEDDLAQKEWRKGGDSVSTRAERMRWVMQSREHQFWFG